MSNARLFVKVHRSGSEPVNYETIDYLDVNAARRDFAKIVSGNGALIIADTDDAGFHMIPVRNITGIQVREADPEEERRKAEERMADEIRKAGQLRAGRHLPPG